MFRGIREDALGSDAPHIAADLLAYDPLVERGRLEATVSHHLPHPVIPSDALSSDEVANDLTDRRPLAALDAGDV